MDTCRSDFLKAAAMAAEGITLTSGLKPGIVRRSEARTSNQSITFTFPNEKAVHGPGFGK